MGAVRGSLGEIWGGRGPPSKEMSKVDMRGRSRGCEGDLEGKLPRSPMRAIRGTEVGAPLGGWDPRGPRSPPARGSGSLRGRGRPRGGLGRPEVSPTRPDPPPPWGRPACPRLTA